MPVWYSVVDLYSRMLKDLQIGGNMPTSTRIMHKLRVGSLGSTIRHQNAFQEASKAFLGFSFWVAPGPLQRRLCPLDYHWGHCLQTPVSGASPRRPYSSAPSPSVNSWIRHRCRMCHLRLLDCNNNVMFLNFYWRRKSARCTGQRTSMHQPTTATLMFHWLKSNSSATTYKGRWKCEIRWTIQFLQHLLFNTSRYEARLLSSVWEEMPDRPWKPVKL